MIGALLLIGLIGCALFYQSMSNGNEGNGRQLEARSDVVGKEETKLAVGESERGEAG